MADAAGAFAEAERRIADWQEGKPLDLAIPGLEVIPEQIKALTTLSELILGKFDDEEFIASSVSDLSPLKDLQSLQTLDCYSTQVSDLSPLKDLQSLQTLSCYNTQVSDLNGLEGLQSLQSLTCSNTQISDLSPLRGIKSLETLVCKDIADTSVPEEVLSRNSFRDNCLERLHAHWNDLGNNPEPLGDAKLMILGNGRIGKTFLSERLHGRDPADQDITSTHGIIVSAIDAPRTGKENEAGQLHVWDFGGQDIYHSTHTLFLKTRAIFAVCWTPTAEEQSEHVYEGMTFRNFPLPYWLDYVARFGGNKSPVITIQTQCDAPEQDAMLSTEANDRLGKFRYKKQIQYSAITERGRGALNDALGDAYDQLPKPLIGTGRLAVKKRLEAMRDEDAKRERHAEQKLNRTLPYASFEKMCDEEGGVSEPQHLLNFLHNAGTVFYADGLFGNQLIIDQAWALDAIYTVFNRDTCFKPLSSNNGAFTRSMLAGLIWDEAGYTPEEQKLFISMMQQCGICFVHRESYGETDAETVYIAPDLLPEQRPSSIGQEWEDNGEISSATLTYELLTPALMRGIIAEIGGAAGLSADYWRNGVYLFERDYRSRAFIEQDMTGDWTGTITIRTQNGRAGDLLQRLVERVQRQEQRLGITSSLETAPDTEAILDQRDDEPKAELAFSRERRANQQWYVSYCNADNTPEKDARIDQLCKKAKQNNREIMRDIEELNYGDSISKFMDMLAEGDRIFIYLTDAYLKSPFCMYELHAIWERANKEGEAFTRKVRVYRADDIPLDDPSQWFGWQDQWTERVERYEERGLSRLAELQVRDYLNVKKFAEQTCEILGVVADRIHSRTLADLTDKGFTDD